MAASEHAKKQAWDLAGLVAALVVIDTLTGWETSRVRFMLLGVRDWWREQHAWLQDRRRFEHEVSTMIDQLDTTEEVET